MAVKLKGIDNVLRNLNKEIAKIEGNLTKKGMVKAVLLVRRDAQKMVPVDTGNLKASAYSHVDKYNGRIEGLVGFTAKYAAWVHEAWGKLRGQSRPVKKGQRKGARGKFWDPQGKARPQFLRVSLLKNKRKILQILRQEAQIK